MATETVERAHAAVVTDDTEQARAPEPVDERLHLKDIRIQGFRCFDDLTVNRLGRVNLIAGRNGIGKSSFLEAVQVLAERGARNSIYRISNTRSEFTEGVDERFGPFVLFDRASIFHGHKLGLKSRAIIGNTDGTNEVVISVRTREDPERGLIEHVEEVFPIGPITYLKVQCNGRIGYIPFTAMFKQSAVQLQIEEGEFELPITLAKLGPDVPSEEMIASLWENVAITPSVEPAIAALGLISGRKVADVAVLGGRDPESRPITLVRIAGTDERVSLRSLGEGAVRAIGYVMALASAKSGILLIDEVENGIHYTVLSEFWSMILRTAQEYDVQVFATTHSWDCIRGFARASVENPDVDCAMFRLGETRITKRLRAVEYTSDDLIVATRQGIEVR